MIYDLLDNLEDDRDTLAANLTTKGVSGLVGDETFTELAPKVLEIEGKEVFFDNTAQYNATFGLTARDLIKKIPGPITITNTSNHVLQGLFFGYSKLISAPEINTTGITDFQRMYGSCTALRDLPVYDTSSATTIKNMVSYCPSFSDESLNNILLMCINVPASYSGTKTLADVGLTSSDYPASRIQALSNYQNFINAGWTIGW